MAISGDVEADTRHSIGAGDTVHDDRLIAPVEINRPVVLFVPEVANETPFEL